LKLKPLATAATVGVGALALAAPALAAPDAAILDQTHFRLNPDTLEPGCYLAGRMDSAHLDLTYLSQGTFATELHISVRDNAPFSVDQVLVPSAIGGYSVYNSFDTGTSGSDPDIDPNQTGVDMFAPDSNDFDGPDPIDRSDVIVCVSDHNDSVTNRPYKSDVVPGEVVTADRPIFQPTIAALGVSAIDNLHTYKVGFGYETQGWYKPFAETGMGPITDPMQFANHVLVPYRADQPGARRVNDFDEFGEEFNDPHSEKAGYGQPVVFHKNGDPYAYLHKSLPGTVDWPAPFEEALADQTSAMGLLTFTTQGDLPLKWTIKPSLAPSSFSRSVSLTDDDLRAWEASWQAYYRGEGPKPSIPLAPGTNSPAPSTQVVVNMPEQAVTVNPPGAAPAQVVQVPVERVVTRTVIKKVHAKSAKKSKAAKKRAACVRKAKAKHGKKRAKAMRRCRAK
jgi:hypothetical protein